MVVNIQCYCRFKPALETQSSAAHLDGIFCVLSALALKQALVLAPFSNPSFWSYGNCLPRHNGQMEERQIVTNAAAAVSRGLPKVRSLKWQGSVGGRGCASLKPQQMCAFVCVDKWIHEGMINIMYFFEKTMKNKGCSYWLDTYELESDIAWSIYLLSWRME